MGCSITAPWPTQVLMRTRWWTTAAPRPRRPSSAACPVSGGGGWEGGFGGGVMHAGPAVLPSQGGEGHLCEVWGSSWRQSRAVRTMEHVAAEVCGRGTLCPLPLPQPSSAAAATAAAAVGTHTCLLSAGVEWAEPDVLARVATASFIPNDPLYPSQWHLPKVSAPKVGGGGWGVRWGGVGAGGVGMPPQHLEFLSSFHAGSLHSALL